MYAGDSKILRRKGEGMDCTADFSHYSECALIRDFLLLLLEEKRVPRGVWIETSVDTMTSSIYSSYRSKYLKQSKQGEPISSSLIFIQIATVYHFLTKHTDSINYKLLAHFIRDGYALPSAFHYFFVLSNDIIVSVFQAAHRLLSMCIWKSDGIIYISIASYINILLSIVLCCIEMCCV